MNDEDYISDDAFYSEETYSKGLSREDTLEKQIRIITYFYSRGLWDEFEYSLKALLPLLPRVVREQFQALPHDINKVEDHYNQFMDIQKLLESDTNMIWKKKFIKTYK
ncbi:MAG: hypothetical protein GF317_09130 [Candidatus Lokiarchaeota archaeon]|nr:hypothetical protein [Candidatus Lokiarchaeota archaeon]